MTQSKHTPAPWKVKTGGKDNERFWIEDMTCETVCDLYWSRGHYPRAKHIPHPNAQANAQLIAAAPELLEALEGLYSIAEIVIEDNAEMKAAKAAINKAKGE